MFNPSLIRDSKAWFRYMPVSQETKLIGAYVTSAGFTVVPRNVVYPPYEHEHPADHYFTWENGRVLQNYQFVYVTRGTGVFESVAGKNLPVRTGDLLILFPHVWHRYKPMLDTGWDEYWVEFSGEFIHRIMEQKKITPENPVWNIGVHDRILDLFLEAIDLLRREPPNYQMLMGTLAMYLIAHVVSISDQRTNEDRSATEVIREAKRWLARNPLQRENLDKLASRLNMSYSAFRQLFKYETGFSPNQFALEIKINKACDLLARTDLPINQIAQQCGMESIYYFSRLFKQKIGLAPTTYRLRRTTHWDKKIVSANPVPQK